MPPSLSFSRLSPSMAPSAYSCGALPLNVFFMTPTARPPETSTPMAPPVYSHGALPSNLLSLWSRFPPPPPAASTPVAPSAYSYGAFASNLLSLRSRAAPYIFCIENNFSLRAHRHFGCISYKKSPLHDPCRYAKPRTTLQRRCHGVACHGEICTI